MPDLIEIVEYNDVTGYVLIQVNDLDLTDALRKDATGIPKSHDHSAESDSPAFVGIWMSLQVNY